MASAKDQFGETSGKPIRCRAAVARKPGEPLVIEEVIVAPPKSGEVRIKIICTSLCFSDVTFWKLKDPPAFYPRILGHESVGVVETVGEGVDGFAEGDVVIPVFVSECAECADCKSNKSNLCSTYPFKVSPWMHDGSSRFTDLNGETIYHFLSVSSFTEYTVVHVANITRVDRTVPPDRVCLLSCGVSTGVGAAWRSANVEAGSTVAIFGLGSIGLAVAEGSRLCGARRIIGIDVNPDKFEIAKSFGVTDFVDSSNVGDKSVSQIINEMTGGGADYCFECVGKAFLVEEAFACCRKGWGKTIVVGVDKPGARISFSSSEVLHLGKTIQGSLFGGLKPKSDIPILIKRYIDKELELDKFVTHESSDEEQGGEKKKKKKGLKKEKSSGEKEEGTGATEKYDDIPVPEPDRKKGLLDKIKEKLPSGKTTDEVAVPPQKPEIVDCGATVVGKEKKGLLNKIKQIIPGYNARSADENGKEACN
ncbi:alcohol dehydrogenase-like 7 [Dorcoceras hygrometricum]|uniref:Alcohol dehydrogenase-like 7 n=1 Tax=Dorcoceras hygrometricum TaxID=472368 RepID=A0A2Z7ALN0_9LAMI|nr:alcohol dehydrogenase-like 7 [Dorcoceras hygrometricum]